MTMRIIQEPLEEGTMLRVAGEVSGSEAEELESSCRNALPPLTLHLEDVIAVDERGVAVLRSAAADGARLIGASPYIAMRLGLRGTKGTGNDATSPGESNER